MSVRRPREGLLAARVCAVLLSTVLQTSAQQSPRVPLAPGSSLQAPNRLQTIAPVQRRQAPAMMPGLAANPFQSNLGNVLDRAALVEIAGAEVQLVNTTNGTFNIRYADRTQAKTMAIEPYKIARLACEACDGSIRIDFHDGVDAKFVQQPVGSRSYIIVHPLYQRFEIIDQLQADRLAGRSQ